MLTDQNTTVILGPPGTGKTTRLISILEEHISKGVNPKNIGFLSFTKKAANEAKERAMKKFKLKHEDVPYFSTLHSLAFRVGGIDKRDVMAYTNYIDICKLLGVTISSQSQAYEDGVFTLAHTKGDRLFFLENLARVKKRALKDIWAMFPDDDIQLAELELLAETLLQYKNIRSKVDFTDMVLQFNQENKPPALEVLIVDEAQDLAPIQWDMVHLLSHQAKSIYIAGDDDQAIYNWAGADVGQFQSVPGKREVLHQSYRISQKVYDIAINIISRIKGRIFKPYKPTEVKGDIVYHSTLDSINMSQGTWFCLARNIYLLPTFSEHCLSRGHIYESKYGNPVSPNAGAAICYWDRLVSGKQITAGQAKVIYEFLGVKTRVKYGYKKVLEAVDDDLCVDFNMLHAKYGLIALDEWAKALDKLRPFEVNFFKTAMKNGEKITSEPRIRINTIHGVKGGEADNVVLITDMSARTCDEMYDNPDDEWRVWYVAITRAKHNIHILHPQTAYFIDI